MATSDPNKKMAQLLGFGDVNYRFVNLESFFTKIISRNAMGLIGLNVPPAPSSDDSEDQEDDEPDSEDDEAETLDFSDLNSDD